MFCVPYWQENNFTCADNNHKVTLWSLSSLLNDDCFNSPRKLCSGQLYNIII